MGAQVRDFIGNIPSLVEEAKEFFNGVIGDLNHTFDYDFTTLR